MKRTILKKGADSKYGLFAAIFTAIAASLCCVGPLVLLALGLGGAWIGNLTALEPLRPYFMGVTFLFLAYAFYRIYRKPKAEKCVPGSYCANPKSDKINKISLWVVTVLIIALFATPYIAGYSVTKAEQSNSASSLVKARLARSTLSVPGMTCPSCPYTIQQSLKKLDGIIQADVNFADKKAVVLYDANKVTVEQMIQATARVGYPSKVLATQELR